MVDDGGQHASRGERLFLRPVETLSVDERREVLQWLLDQERLTDYRRFQAKLRQHDFSESAQSHSEQNSLIPLVEPSKSTIEANSPNDSLSPLSPERVRTQVSTAYGSTPNSMGMGGQEPGSDSLLYSTADLRPQSILDVNDDPLEDTAVRQLSELVSASGEFPLTLDERALTQPASVSETPQRRPQEMEGTGLGRHDEEGGILHQSEVTGEKRHTQAVPKPSERSTLRRPAMPAKSENRPMAESTSATRETPVSILLEPSSKSVDFSRDTSTEVPLPSLNDFLPSKVLVSPAEERLSTDLTANTDWSTGYSLPQNESFGERQTQRRNSNLSKGAQRALIIFPLAFLVFTLVFVIHHRHVDGARKQAARGYASALDEASFVSYKNQLTELTVLKKGKRSGGDAGFWDSLTPTTASQAVDEVKYLYELALRTRLFFVYKDQTQHQPLKNILRAQPRTAASQDANNVSQLFMALESQKDIKAKRIVAALPRDGSNPDVHWAVGEYFLYAEKYEAAVTRLKQALEIAPRHPFAQLALARAREKNGDLNQAFIDLDELLSQRPSFALGSLMMARLSLEQPQRRSFGSRLLESLTRRKHLSGYEKSKNAFLLGRYAFLSKKYREAEQHWLLALKEPSYSFQTQQFLFRLYAKERRFEDLKAFFEANFQSKHRRTTLNGAYIAFLEGDVQRAESLLMKSGRKNPLSKELAMAIPVIRLMTARWLLDDESVKIAQRAAEQALASSDPSQSTPARLSLRALLGEAIKASELTQHRNATYEPSGLAVISWQQAGAIIEMTKGEWDGARRLLKTKARATLHPLTNFLNCKIGIVTLKIKRGIAACSAAIKEAKFRPARRLIAELYERRSDYEAVKAILNTEVSTNDLSLGDLFRLARAHYQLGEMNALLTLNGRLGQEGTEPLRYFILGLLAVETDGVDDGLARLRKVADARAKDQWTLTLLGELFGRLNRPREAQEYFERAMRLSTDPYPAIGLAKLLLKFGEPKECERYAEMAERISLKSPSPSRFRAASIAIRAQAKLALGGRKGIRKAIGILQKAIRVDPNDLTVGLARGGLAERRRQRKKALRIYRKLYKRFPNSDQLKFQLGRLLVSKAATRRDGRAYLVALKKTGRDSHLRARAQQLLKRY